MERKRVWSAIVSVGVLTLSSGVHAALSSATDSKVSFEAAGPAGMKIDGTTSDLSVADDSGNVVVTVPLGNLTTGIGLRDHHMKEKYLEVPKYPAATLTIARSAMKFPNGAEPVKADVPAMLQLHGQSHPVTVHYDAKATGNAFDAHGAFHINMNDYGIAVPVYLGVTVKPDIDVAASFHVTGS
jgi:polyisoprenoid-binding protein YceI